jgi:hypothetical protein
LAPHFLLYALALLQLAISDPAFVLSAGFLHLHKLQLTTTLSTAVLRQNKSNLLITIERV